PLPAFWCILLWRLIMDKMKILRFGLLLIPMFLFIEDVDAQCAMCKAVAESNGAAGGSVANGLNGGILYLMAFPYLLGIGVIYLWYRHNKKMKAKDQVE